MILQAAILTCCAGKSGAGNGTAEQKSQDAKTATDKAPNYLITAKGAGDFVLGKEAPASVAGYEIKKELKDGEEGTEDMITVLYEKGEKALEIISDDSKVFYPEIIVYSDKYHTDKGAKTGTTLDELVKMYPKYSLWFSYISDWFTFTPEETERIQFRLDSKGFTGKEDSLYRSDRIELSLKDFKPDTKVIAIRIY